MYAPFFGLQQSPFSIAPDPRYLFMSERHREALAHLLYGVRGGGGFVLLTGEIGAGKTTVCRCFLEQVPAHCRVAYIFNPKLSVIELLQSVCDEFGVAVPGGAGAASVKTHVDALNAQLLAMHAQGRQGLLIIDEAQHLSAEVLEQLRLLTNLETNERKLLQIVLIGQPELRTLLAGAGMEQLAQRVIARFHLGALSAPETAAYVAHRLAVGGLTGANPFEGRALRRIHALTAGVPRRINLLCDRALLGAYAEGRAQVGRRIVDRAAQEVFGPPAPERRRQRLLAGAVVVLAAGGLGGLGWLAWQGRAPARSEAAGPVLAAAPAASVAYAASSASSSASASLGADAASAVPAAVSPAVPPFDERTDWARLPQDEAEALRELATRWGLSLPAGAPCAQAERQQLGCWRSTAGTLPLLQRLDRPVVITLADAGGRLAHVRLEGVNAEGVLLAAGDRRWTMPLAQLAARWRGGVATFWRMPSGYQHALAPGARGPAVATLAEGLARHAGHAPGTAVEVYDSALLQQVAAFQLASGLMPDGLAGPTTFMMLNRALGLDEPHLGRE
jgi:general secretion pathway protein A